MEENHFKELDWLSARDSVIKVNPELAAIIDKIDPPKALKLIKASYSFGDLIVKEGRLQVPSNGDIYKPYNPITNNKLKEKLCFSNIPLTLLLNKKNDIFITENDRIIPLKVFKPGTLLGTFETVNFLCGIPSNPLWNVSAGSRLIFSLPKISDKIGIQRIQNEYSTSTDNTAHSLVTHWDLFRQIANHKEFKEKWKSDTLFFTADWFKHKAKDTRWLELREYIFKQAWLQSRQSLLKEELAVMWQSFMKAIAARRLHSTPYLIDTLKHIFLIFIGEFPAFQPLIHSNLSAPISGLQKAIVDVYGLKKYAPILMDMWLPEKGALNSFYYSLAVPTLFEGSPLSKTNSSTIMLDIKTLKTLIETVLKDQKVRESFLKEINLSYFHIEEDKYQEIKPSLIIPSEDKSFNMPHFKGLEFCSTSQFWRGCVKINSFKSSF